MPTRWLPLLQRIHHEINIALWASLTAMLIMFVIFVAPNIKEAQAKQQSVFHAEVSAENDHYCRRWRFRAGTNDYRSCLDDLWQLRKSIAERLEQDQWF